MKERIIRWESYHMPNQFDYEGKSEKEQILDELDEDDEEDQLIAEEIRNAPRLVESPFGIVEVSSVHNIYLQFEFWMMHSNFDIRSREFVLTNFHEGVEVVRAEGRYRLLIGFGKLFDSAEVRRSLEEKLKKIEEYPEQLYRKQRRLLANC